MKRITMPASFTALAAVGVLLFAAGPPAGAQDGTALTTTVVVQPHVARAALLSTPPPAPEGMNHRELEAYSSPRPPDREGAAEAQVGPTSPETVVGQPSSILDAALSSPNDFVVQRNTSLGYAGTNGDVSSTNEPSLAESNSDVVFYSGNQYASLSLDGGQTFNHVSPYTTFPASYGGFWCDQVVHYDRSHDLFIWLLQYQKDSNANNIHRIAVATSADLRNGSGWTYWDITPQLLGWPDHHWLDFPDMAVGSNYLYVTSSMFKMSENRATGSTVWRTSLADLAARGALGITYTNNIGYFDPRLTQGATTTMYWGFWDTSTSIRIHDWPDGGNPNYSNVNVNAFNWMDRGTGHAVSPDGTDFANFADSRILGAWTNGGEIGFMWNAKQGGGFPYPQVQVARFTMAKALTSQVAIWSSFSAWIFPSVNVDSRGHIGGSIAYGGGAYYPQTAVWIADDVNGGSFEPFEYSVVTNGTNGPGQNRWGDYLTSRRHPGFGGNSWVASAYSLVGGVYDANAEPRFVWFGRQRDLPTAFSYSGQMHTGYTIPSNYYSFPVLASSWSVVGINPSTDHDVYVDNHNDLSAPYATSTYGGTVRDFTVTNGFIWGNATHYAQVRFGSNSTYYLEAEWDLTNITMNWGRSSSFWANEVLEAAQVNLTAGLRYTVKVDITSGSADPAMFVFSPNVSAGSRYTAPWSANATGAGGTETLTFTATASGWHCIVLTDENGEAGGYDLMVAPVPANDEICAAAIIASLPYSISENTYLATTSPSDPITTCGAPNSQQLKSVWFTITPTYSGDVQADTFSSDYDTVLALRWGSGDCNAWYSEIGCNDDFGGGVQSKLTWYAWADTTYYIEAMAYGTTFQPDLAGGNLALHVSYVPPANDNCASATLLTNPDDTRTQMALGGTAESGEPVPGCVAGIHDTVWYEFIPAETGVVTLSTVGSDYDTVLGVYTGTCGALTLQACNDDQPGGSDRASAVALNVTAGVPYFVQVGAFEATGGGSLRLEYHSGPPCATIAEARCLDIGTKVSLCDETLTGKWGSLLFVQESDRSAGTAISGTALGVGTKVTVVGVTQRTGQGDIYVLGNPVGVSYAGTLYPLGMTNKTVGGAAACNQAGVTGASGVNNVSLLVQTWGIVTSIDPVGGYYWIDDGSNLTYNAGHIGLRVRTLGTLPSVEDIGAYRQVTGHPWMWTPAGTPILLEVIDAPLAAADLDKSQRTNGGPAKADLGPSPLLGQ